MNLYEITDARCGCKQHPAMLVPLIFHQCRKPQVRDWEAFDLREQAEGGASGYFQWWKKDKQPVYDALAEEEARAPITRYMRGGVPEYDEEPFTDVEGGRRD